MKRQAESEVDECIENTLMRTLTDSECDERLLEALIGDVSDLNEDEDDADFVTNYGLFCQPECREPIVNALQVCNFFNGSDFLRDFLVDLCAVNENGTACYTIFNSTTEFITETELPCYLEGLRRKECNCTAELQSAVSERGCCLNIYHTAIQGHLEEREFDFRYVPEDLYNMYCDVGLPRDCDGINSSVAPPDSDDTDGSMAPPDSDDSNGSMAPPDSDDSNGSMAPPDSDDSNGSMALQHTVSIIVTVIALAIFG